MVSVIGTYRIETRGTATGWRVTSIDQSTGAAHEFFVHDGAIYHVSLWNNSSQFVVGARVKKIMDSERHAILEAVGDSSTAASSV
jgi:hypothetical protein